MKEKVCIDERVAVTVAADSKETVIIDFRLEHRE